MKIGILTFAALFLSLTTTELNGAARVSSYSQDAAPSLEETLKWLQNKLSSDAAFSETSSKKVGSTITTFSKSERVTLLNWEGCTLKFSYLYQSSFYPDVGRVGDTRIETKTTVRLADVKAAGVVTSKGVTGIEYYIVGLFSDKKFLEESDTGTQNVWGVSIPFKDKEIADRVAKAINHAMSLCKEKKEPF